MFERYHRELLNFFDRAMDDRQRAADGVQQAYARVSTAQAIEVRSSAGPGSRAYSRPAITAPAAMASKPGR